GGRVRGDGPSETALGHPVGRLWSQLRLVSAPLRQLSAEDRVSPRPAPPPAARATSHGVEHVPPAIDVHAQGKVEVALGLGTDDRREVEDADIVPVDELAHLVAVADVARPE